MADTTDKPMRVYHPFKTGEGDWSVNSPQSDGSPPHIMDSRKRYACGRRAALGALDAMLSGQRNVQKLYDALQALFDDSPADFYERFGLVTTPRAVMEEMAAEPVAATTVVEQIKAMLEASGFRGGVVGTEPTPTEPKEGD